MDVPERQVFLARDVPALYPVVRLSRCPPSLRGEEDWRNSRKEVVPDAYQEKLRDPCQLVDQELEKLENIVKKHDLYYNWARMRLLGAGHDVLIIVYTTCIPL